MDNISGGYEYRPLGGYEFWNSDFSNRCEWIFI
jgi:hypothetical protein